MLYRFIDLFSGAIVPLVVALLLFSIVKKASAKKTILIVLFTIYLAEMLDIVGISDIQSWCWNPIVNVIPFSDFYEKGFLFQVVFQYVANIILFIPFGFLLPVIWKSFRRFHFTMIAGILASICIEINQLFSFRVTAVDDLLMNTLGTIIGYLVIAGFAKKSWKKNDASAVMNDKWDIIELLIVVGLAFVSAMFVKYIIGALIYSLPLFK